MSEQTKKQLQQAFSELIYEKPFDKIRIKDIVERCGYNRNTFYYYYSDIYGIVEDVMIAQTRGFVANVQNGSPWNVEAEKLTRELKASKSYSHLYRFIERADMEKFLFHVCDEMVGCVIEQSLGGVQIPDDDKKIIRTFYRCALTGILLEWMDGGMKIEAQSLMSRVEQIVSGGMRYALQMSGQKK